MGRLADPARCPDCSSPLVPGAARCAVCGLVLTGPLAQELFVTLTRADDLLHRMREQPASVGGPVGRPVRTPPADSTPTSPPASPLAVLPALPGVGQPGHRGGPVVRAVSVPKILLGLGAVCLLVAALVFLAVAWSVLGVAGRTAVLVALTAGAGALTAWVARRGLRGATEALGLVTTGLGVLDVVGARNAGWIGRPSDGTFLVLLGLLLGVAGLGATEALARTKARGFTVGELTAVTGTAVLAVGLAGQQWGSAAGRLAVASVVTVVVAGLVLAATGRGTSRLSVAAPGVAGVAALTWLALLGTGIDHLGDHPSVVSVWGRFDAWPLLVAAALAVGVASGRWPEGRLVTGVRAAVRVVALGAALVALTAALVAPALDEGTTAASLAGVVVVLAAAAALAFAPRPWSLAALGIGLLGSLYLTVVVLVLASAALAQYAAAAERRWSGHPGDRFIPPTSGADAPEAWVLPLCVAALAVVVWAAVCAVRRAPAAQPGRRVVVLGAGLVGAALIGVLLLSAVPVWVVVAVLAATALGCAAPAVLLDDPVSQVLTALALAATGGLALYADELTLAALAVALVPAVTLHLRSLREATAEVAGAAVPPLVAALAWTCGAVIGGAPARTSLAGLVVLAALALGRVAVPARTRTAWTVAVVEVSAGLSAVPLALAGIAGSPDGHRATWAAVYLTVGGAAATAMALLREDRRRVGWLGGALLVTATWVRLADLGVHAPEPYTLPAATGLVVVGLARLHRDRQTGTLRALGPGLTLALVPSLLWVLDDPATPRALLLGLGCLALVLAGARLRWAAPLLCGALAGGLLVLREAAPYVVAAVPRWGLIGAAGVLLIALGATWEQRLTNARNVTGRLRALR